MADAFVSLGQPAGYFLHNFAVDHHGSVYVGSDGLYKRTNGAGSFSRVFKDYSGPPTEMQAVCVLPNGNVLTAASGSPVYIQTNHDGDFVAQSGTTYAWRSIWCNSSGVLWGAVYGGYVMKSTDGGATWTQASQNTGNWSAGCCQGDDVYAAISGGNVWKQTGGTGDFVEQSSTTKSWTQLAVTAAGLMVGSAENSPLVVRLTKDSAFTTLLESASRAWRGIVEDASGGFYSGTYFDSVYYAAPTGGGGTTVSIDSLSTSAPVLGTPTVQQIQEVSPLSLITGEPSLGAPTVTQIHAVTASVLSAGTPTLGTPDVTNVPPGQIEVASLSTSAPSIGSPSVEQDHAISTTNLATSSPTVGSTTVSQVHAIALAGISTSAPSLGTPDVSNIPPGAIEVIDLTSGQVSVGSPSIAQIHAFATTTLSTGSPVLGSPAVDRKGFGAIVSHAVSVPLFEITTASIPSCTMDTD